MLYDRVAAISKDDTDACIVFRGGVAHAMNNLYGQVTEAETSVNHSRTGETPKTTTRENRNGNRATTSARYSTCDLETCGCFVRACRILAAHLGELDRITSFFFSR